MYVCVTLQFDWSFSLNDIRETQGCAALQDLTKTIVNGGCSATNERTASLGVLLLLEFNELNRLFERHMSYSAK